MNEEYFFTLANNQSSVVELERSNTRTRKNKIFIKNFFESLSSTEDRKIVFYIQKLKWRIRDDFLAQHSKICIGDEFRTVPKPEYVLYSTVYPSPRDEAPPPHDPMSSTSSTISSIYSRLATVILVLNFVSNGCNIYFADPVVRQFVVCGENRGKTEKEKKTSFFLISLLTHLPSVAK